MPSARGIVQGRLALLSLFTGGMPRALPIEALTAQTPRQACSCGASAWPKGSSAYGRA